MAALRDSNVNVTLTFDMNTLQRNLTINADIYCKDNASNIYWNGTILSRTQIVCFVSFFDHNKTAVNFEVILKVPNISFTDVILSTNFKSLIYLSNILFSILICQKQVKFLFHYQIKPNLNTLQHIYQ
jgi:hypothetical protein